MDRKGDGKMLEGSTQGIEIKTGNAGKSNPKRQERKREKGNVPQ